MDAPLLESLLVEWLDWKPESGRNDSIKRAISNHELLVAEVDSRLVGFIHYVVHEDVIDGGPNAFITAFYVTASYRGRGVGTLLLDRMIKFALEKGVVGVEVSTVQDRAREFYLKHYFKQTIGDISEVFLELDIDEYLRVKRQD